MLIESIRRCSRGAMICLLAVAVEAVLIEGAAVADRPGQAERRRQVQLNKYEALQAKFAKSLEEVAAQCDQNGFPKQAAAIRELGVPLPVDDLRTLELPDKIQPDIANDLSPAERRWRVELRHLQQEQAIQLYQLAQRVIEIGEVRFAYQLIQEAVRQDPDNKSVRSFLGYERSGDEWTTPFLARMRQKHYVNTEKFGWLPRDHVKRYEKGDRYFRSGRGSVGRWVSAAQEAELRRSFKNAWEVESEHYLIKTNHSLERGVELSRQLEQFYRVFFQTFSGFLTTQDQRSSLAKGRRRSTKNQFEIHYFSNKEDYVEALRPRVPEISITTGLYLTDTGIAYFYHQPEMDEDPEGPATRTIFHEATHQLFAETRKTRRKSLMVGEHAHFWIIEGIACYMESFAKKGDRYELGDPMYQRFRAARYRYLEDDYYIPLGRFASQGANEIQHSIEIRKLYSQASGLTHFFMHYKDGKYRDALIEHLSQLYSTNLRVRERPATLPQLIGTDYKTLDEQYGEYMRAEQERLTAQANK
ncbi:hypothetical protein Mal52_03290 [Symmachiella dynata]|uniref:DUF1570 domain-containing protein n=1 Tax=Symmachiella dynata TaxID=2527995 RepID=A0A517ZHC1_9PLAN|nr:hypothetical protein Mal52_03290 [Symmachiella dynata]